MSKVYKFESLKAAMSTFNVKQLEMFTGLEWLLKKVKKGKQLESMDESGLTSLLNHFWQVQGYLSCCYRFQTVSSIWVIVNVESQLAFTKVGFSNLFAKTVFLWEKLSRICETV